VLQVHAHARPRVEAPAHGVHEHVGRLQMCGGLRVARAPAFESGQRLLLAIGASDLDQRVDGYAAARWLDAGRLAGLLAVLRRPWRVAKAISLLTT
jgi:hypothetical protein